MRETCRDRAKVDALGLPRVEDRLVRWRVLHRRVEDRVSELPSRHVLKVGCAGDRERRRRGIREVYDPRRHVERRAVAGKLQARAEDVHPWHVGAADDGIEGVGGLIAQAGDRGVCRAAHGCPEESDSGRLPRDRDHSRAGVVDESRRRDESAGLLNEAIRRVVVHDLRGARLVDRDDEEVGEVAVALTCDARRSLEADVVVVHRVRGDLDERLRRGFAGHRSVLVDGIHDLRHEDVP